MDLEPPGSFERDPPSIQKGIFVIFDEATKKSCFKNMKFSSKSETDDLMEMTKSLGGSLF